MISLDDFLALAEVLNDEQVTPTKWMEAKGIEHEALGAYADSVIQVFFSSLMKDSEDWGTNLDGKKVKAKDLTGEQLSDLIRQVVGQTFKFAWEACERLGERDETPFS